MLSWLSSVLQGYQWLLLDGLWQTLLISVMAYLIGSAIGFCLALANGTSVRSIHIAIKTYTYLFRALPELILIMLLYYASDDLFGWIFKLFGFGQLQLNGTTAAIIVLAVVSAAFACEIFGAAIKAVPIGMVEDAISLGMGPMLRLRRIIFPIMLPLALPGLANLWLMVVRGSSLVSVVGVMELALAAMAGMVRDLMPNRDVMKAAASTGFSTATDLADWLVQKLKMPFREAHHVSGRIVALAEKKNVLLSQLSLAELQSVHGAINASVFKVLSVEASVKSRTSFGGTAPSNVKREAKRWLKILKVKTK